MKKLTIVRMALNALVKAELLELDMWDGYIITDITDTDKIHAVIEEVENTKIYNFYSSVEFYRGGVEWFEKGKNTALQYVCKPYEKAIELHLDNYDLHLYFTDHGNYTEMEIYKKGHKSHKIII